MKDPNWIESMQNLGSIRLFASLYLRKARKGAVTSAQEVDMLFRVALGERLTTPLELSREMGISKTMISRLIENLTGKQLIEKVYNKEDKRSYFLSVTEKGKAELDTMYYYYLDPLYELQKNLGEASYSELLRLIEKANHSMTGESKEEFF